MAKLTASDLIKEIERLGTQRVIAYVSGRSHMQITQVTKPEGPVRFVNINPDGSLGRRGSISREMLAKIAFVCSSRPNYPVHIDRVFSAGGNTRSALETLLAHTSNFFICYPKRLDVYSGEVLQNLKHIMWRPEDRHPFGQIEEIVFDEVITEIEFGVDFGYIGITAADLGAEFDSIEAKTTHTQMQIALIEIGRALNFETWIARNDRSIKVRETTLGQMTGVLPSLDAATIFHRREMKEKAALIDCIWFTDEGRTIPAVIEIEHSTGVTSGLTRMSKLRETLGSITPTFTIVAPDHLRNKVIAEANDKHFRNLNARYMSSRR